MPYVAGFGKAFGKLFTSVKQVSGTISEGANTRLPGIRTVQKYWAKLEQYGAGIDFIRGQPDTIWLNNAVSKGLLQRQYF